AGATARLVPNRTASPAERIRRRMLKAVPPTCRLLRCTGLSEGATEPTRVLAPGGFPTAGTLTTTARCSQRLSEMPHPGPVGISGLPRRRFGGFRPILGPRDRPIPARRAHRHAPISTPRGRRAPPQRPDCDHGEARAAG